MVVGWRSVPCDDDHELPSLCKVLHGLSFSFCFVLHFCVVVLARHKFATSLCEQRGCTWHMKTDCTATNTIHFIKHNVSHDDKEMMWTSNHKNRTRQRIRLAAGRIRFNCPGKAFTNVSGSTTSNMLSNRTKWLLCCP